ncbi:hypothetical protein Tco_0999410, partial [Tanacetum coccineum]
MADLIQNNLALEERLDKQGTRIYNLENLNIPHKVSQPVDEIVTDAVDWAMQASLRARFRDLPTVDMKEILQQRMSEDNSYKAHEAHNDLYEALQKSLEIDYSNQCLADQEEARKKKKKKCVAPRTPSGSPHSPPPPPAGASGTLGTSGASGSSQLPPPPPPPSTGALASDQLQGTALELSPTDYLMQDDSIPEEQTIPSSNKSDVVNNWASALAITYEPPVENSWLAKIGDMTTFMNWYCQKMDECHKMLTAQVDWANPEGDHYLRYGSKGSNPALSISKMKAASYPEFGLELLVPEQMWIDDVCTYDISEKYGISHCVVRIKAYSRYGYDYLSEIILRRAAFQEYTIVEKDFKNLYPSNFEDLNLLLLQGHLDHLLGSNKRMLSTTQLNLTKPGWDATGYEFKHDYTIIESPRAVMFPVDNNDRKIIRFNEIYKFSDGTLTRILEALDYRVKEFKVKRLNPGMNTRFWTQKDVTRNKEFIAAIEKRLKTKRIFQNLE